NWNSMRDDLHGPARPGPGGTVGDQVTGAWSDARSFRPSSPTSQSLTARGFWESTEAPRIAVFFRRETTVFCRLVALSRCWFTSHPSPELRFSNADPCSSSGGPDRRGSSAGAVGDVRLRARSIPPAIAGYLVRQSGPNTLSKPQDGSGAATSGVWTVAA